MVLGTYKQCGVLSDPSHGKVKQKGRSKGATAVHTCDKGFKIEPFGKDVLTCEAGGKWSSEQPYCRRAGNCLAFRIVLQNSIKLLL